MSPSTTILILLLPYTLLLVVLAFVSAMETASFAANDLRAQFTKLPPGRLRENLMSIQANPFHHMQRTLLLSALLNLSLSTLVLYVAFEPLKLLGYNSWYTAPGLFFFTVVIGDVLPKITAVRSPALILRRTAWALQPLRKWLDPIATLAEQAADRLLRTLVPKRVSAHQSITRDEVDTLVDMRQEQGALDASEAAILTEVIDIADLSVRDCMVPRVDLTLVEGNKSDEFVTDALSRSITRFAVIYQDTPDTVMGIVDVQDWKLAARPPWRTVLKPAVFVPETYFALDALTHHLYSPRKCLLISDEYGGLEGMVSQEELVDWLLYDAAPWQGESAEIRALDEVADRFLADGTTRVDDICDRFDIQIDAPGIDTIGGYVFNELGYLPKQGERLKHPQVEIKVRRVSRRRIQQVELRLVQPSPQAEEIIPADAEE